MAYYSFLLEPISCHAWNKDRSRKSFHPLWHLHRAFYSSHLRFTLKPHTITVHLAPTRLPNKEEVICYWLPGGRRYFLFPVRVWVPFWEPFVLCYLEEINALFGCFDQHFGFWAKRMLLTSVIESHSLVSHNLQAEPLDWITFKPKNVH